jgi:23S rRNA (guanosine2251-2'-O)-methyltransferase
MPDRQRRNGEEPGSTFNSPADARLFGLMPVLEALRAGGRQFEEISIAEGAHDHRFHELLELAREAKIPVRRVPRSALARTGGAVHQGVVARVAAARYADTELLFSLLAGKVGTENPPLVTVLDGVEDPRNLGAILRTVDCAGGDGVLIPERRAVGLTDVVAKSSAGAVEHVPIARVTNMSRAIDELKSIGIWTVGASADAKTEYVDWDWTLPTALVLGNEGSGLHRLVREHCDTLVRIPVFGQIDSLNVSVAAGVILYEARRQRRKAEVKD